MNDLSIWELISSSAAGGEPSMLLITVEKTGSGPGSTGDMMAVTRGDQKGSVGGGAMELELTGLSREMLKTGADTSEFRLYSHNPEIQIQGSGIAPSGAICSGNQRILLFPVQPWKLPVLEQVMKTLGERGTLPIHLSPRGIEILKGSNTGKMHFEFQDDENWSCCLILGERDTVYIIGGGHVGLALARALEPLPFNTVVLDPRPGMENMLPETCRWEKVDWCDAHGAIPSGGNSWVVVMTPEHEADLDVLASLATGDYAYVGLMAGASKKHGIFSALRSSGTGEGFLESVRCPVGLPIGSRLPAEIAVSIAAQLIKEKRGREKGK